MQNMQKYLRSSQMCKSSYTIPFRKMGNFSLTLGVDRQQYSFWKTFKKGTERICSLSLTLSKETRHDILYGTSCIYIVA